MPLYEYRCHRCGETFEVRQKFADEPLKVHPDCCGEVERLISAPTFQFKGTGWYVTDYGRNGKPDGANGSKAASESKSDSKTEAPKSDKKTEAKPAPAKS